LRHNELLLLVIVTSEYIQNHSLSQDRKRDSALPDATAGDLALEIRAVTQTSSLYDATEAFTAEDLSACGHAQADAEHAKSESMVERLNYLAASDRRLNSITSHRRKPVSTNEPLDSGTCRNDDIRSKLLVANYSRSELQSQQAAGNPTRRD
jgi:hypothetical protein